MKRESEQAYAAFSIYLRMSGERSLAEVAKRVGKSAPLMEKWSRRYRWVERVREHDASIEVKKTDQADGALLRAHKKLTDAIENAVGVVIEYMEGSDMIHPQLVPGKRLRFDAALEILDRVGLIKRKELVIKGDEDSPIRYVIEVPARSDSPADWQKKFGNGQHKALPPGVRAAVEAEVLEEAET